MKGEFPTAASKRSSGLQPSRGWSLAHVPIRKSLFVSAISWGHCLFPRCLLNPTAIQKIALSKEGLRFSLDGCYVGMDSDMPSMGVWSWRCPTCVLPRPPLPGPEIQRLAPSSPHHRNLVPRPALGQGKDSPECSLEVQKFCTLATPVRMLDVGVDEER